jgi:hypothetical protein
LCSEVLDSEVLNVPYFFPKQTVAPPVVSHKSTTLHTHGDFKYSSTEESILVSRDQTVSFYRKFVARFLVVINHEQIEADKSSLRLDVEIGIADVKKLRLFTNTTNNSCHIHFMSDVTDILTGMLLRSQNINITSNPVIDNAESCGSGGWPTVFDLVKLPIQIAITVGLVVVSFNFFIFFTIFFFYV